MGNQDLFKEAIAEAKTIREAAIANAKVALEETLTPHLKSLLSQRLMEMEKEDEEEVVSEEEEVEEMANTKGNFNAQTDAPEDQLEESDDEAEDDSEKSEDEAEEEKPEGEESDEEAEDIDVKDMEIEDLKQLIRDVLAQEMESVPTGDEMGPDDMNMDVDMDMDAEPQPDDMVSTDDEEIDLEELLAELEGMVKGEKKVEEANTRKVNEKEKEVKKDLDEALKTINILKNELSEINLLNAKLLYLNKVLNASNLTEAQKAGVITAFDKASSLKEVKLVYETVRTNFNKPTKNPIKENRGFASKSAGTAPKREVITEVDEQIRRMQKLAGIIK